MRPAKPSLVAGLPPGPVLNAAEWLDVERTQPTSLYELSSAYGPSFTIYVEGRPPRVYVADPDTVREVFVHHSADLEGQGTNLFKPLVGDGSLTFLNGSRHSVARRVMSRSLNPHDLRQRARTMADIVAEELSAIPGDGGMPLQDFTNEVTRKIIIKLTFGSMSAESLLDLLDAFDRAVASLHAKQAATLASSEHGVRMAIEQFEHADADLDRLLRRQLELRRDPRETREPAILDHLMRDRTLSAALSDEEIICYLITIMVSGQETTSASLAWALRHIARQPDITERLRRELATADMDEPADYLTLPYLQAVCMETLRHSAPVPNGSAQKVVNGFTASGYTFPVGVEIVPCICVSHLWADNFSRPEIFDPQRFLDRDYRNNAYLPFSVGIRYCPGSAMAQQELAVVLAVIVGRPEAHIIAEDDDLAALSMGPTVRVPASVMIRRTESTAPAPQEGV